MGCEGKSTSIVRFDGEEGHWLRNVVAAGS